MFGMVMEWSFHQNRHRAFGMMRLEACVTNEELPSYLLIFLSNLNSVRYICVLSFTVSY